jgi:formylglycine-generating enzyme required for sulfatase activity
MKAVTSVVLFLFLAVCSVASEIPVVTNVVAVQLDGTQLVQVTYDVSDADNDKMTVSLQISADAGITWDVPVLTVTGDIGDSIPSGTNYEIIWNAGIDYPEHAGTQYKAKVLASDNRPRYDGMVLVPAGSFVMGNVDEGLSTPEHTVNVPAFYIDIYEVTNAQYKAFCDSTSRAYPQDPGFSGMPNYFTNPAYVNYPVVYVDWNDARAYAVWAGKRLPSEAEWERAAKGNTDNRRWPWGDTWIAANANIGDGNPDGYTYTSPVGTYPSGISPAGCYDMAGNIWEWCEDDEHSDYAGAPTDGSAWIDDPRGNVRVFRGGSCADGIWDQRCAHRLFNDQSERNFNRGFRCAKTP